MSNTETSQQKESLKNHRKFIKRWMKLTIPEKGKKVKGNNFKTGSLIISKSSIRECIGHSRHENVLQSLIDIFEIAKEFKYLGWAEVDTKKHKHKDVTCFIYYSLNIQGRTYYANVKYFKSFQKETLYAILETCNIDELRQDELPQ